MAVLVAETIPYWHETVSPSGPVTETVVILPPQPAISASTVPSPPSASGRLDARVDERHRRAALEVSVVGHQRGEVVDELVLLAPKDLREVLLRALVDDHLVEPLQR